MKKNWYYNNINTSSLKIGVPPAYLFDGLDPDMTEVMENVYAKLMAEGIALVERDI